MKDCAQNLWDSASCKPVASGQLASKTEGGNFILLTLEIRPSTRINDSMIFDINPITLKVMAFMLLNN